MSSAVVEGTIRRGPELYERALRRQMKQFNTRDAAVTYLAPGQPRSYRSGSGQMVEHPHGPEWPVAVPAYRYARGQLARLVVEHEEAGLEAPSAIAYVRMLHLLRAVLAEDSVFPTMSADEEGGIIAEWRIANYSLEVDIDPNGRFSYTIRHEGRRTGGGRSQTPLRKMIRDVSAVVAHVNPNWRSLFQYSSAPIAR